MLAPALVLLTSLAAQAPAPGPVQVETSSVTEDPFDSLWAPDPSAPLPSDAPAGEAPGGPRLDEGPGAPRLHAPQVILPPAPTSIVRTTQRRWFRWPVLIADLVFAATAFVGFGLENTALVATGALGYAFTAPAIHWYNGDKRGGMLSLGMHALGPTVVGLLGAFFGLVANSASCTGSNCGGSDRPFFFGGVAVGATAVTVIEMLVLANVDEPLPITAGPVFDRRGDVTTFGIGGRF